MVRKFNPTKDYLFRLRAENDFGVSDPSMSVSYYGKRGESFSCELLLFVMIVSISPHACGHHRYVISPVYFCVI